MRLLMLTSEQDDLPLRPPCSGDLSSLPVGPLDTGKQGVARLVLQQAAGAALPPGGGRGGRGRGRKEGRVK